MKKFSFLIYMNFIFIGGLFLSQPSFGSCANGKYNCIYKDPSGQIYTDDANQPVNQFMADCCYKHLKCSTCDSEDTLFQNHCNGNVIYYMGGVANALSNGIQKAGFFGGCWKLTD